MSQYPSGWGECSICGERLVFEGRSTCGCKAKPEPPCPNCAKLREALTNITTEIVKSTDLAVRMVEAEAWAGCALNLSLSVNKIKSIAAQALAEPGGKP